MVVCIFLQTEISNCPISTRHNVYTIDRIKKFMKLIKTKETDIAENYLELHYKKIDAETAAVIEQIKASLDTIEGMFDGNKVSLLITDIFYFEIVDRKTFAYTKDMCIEVKVTLQSIVDEYSRNGFIRIGKSTVVNAFKIKQLQGDYNMRVMIHLKNGEKLVMNRCLLHRKYIYMLSNFCACDGYTFTSLLFATVPFCSSDNRAISGDNRHSISCYMYYRSIYI